MTLSVNCSTMPSVSLLYFLFLNVSSMHSFSGDTMSLANVRTPVSNTENLWQNHALQLSFSLHSHFCFFFWEPEMKCAKQSIKQTQNIFALFVHKIPEKEHSLWKTKAALLYYRTCVFFTTSGKRLDGLDRYF